MATPAARHPEQAAELSTIKELARFHGVGRFVLAQPSFLNFDNSRILSALNDDPKHLRGVVWLAAATPPGELRRLAGLGVVGLRFPLMFGGPIGAPFQFSSGPPDWESYRDLLQEAAALGIHTELGLEGPPLVDALRKQLDMGVEIVIAHCGMFDRALGPDADPAFDFLLETAGTGKVWVKLSAPYRAAPEKVRRAVDRLLKAFGPDRLVWGSDWPHAGPKLDRVKTYPTTFNWLCDMIADRDLADRILSRSPQALYRFA